MRDPMNVRPVAGDAAAETDLEIQLRALGRLLAIPSGPSTPLAARVTARLLDERPQRARCGWLWPSLRFRRSTILALAAALIITAIAAAAVGLNLPGLRIIFGPLPSLPPTATPGTSNAHLPGALLGLGSLVSPEEAQALVDFALVRPSDPDIGPPDATYVRLGRVAFVWAPTPTLPATTDREIGLLLNEFHGTYDETVVEKVADSGTHVEPVTVNGSAGYWIAGAPHFMRYRDPSGEPMDDTYRGVGQTLIWAANGVTFRLETALDRDAAIRLAESLR